MGLQTTKNFLVANAVENILAVPKKVTEEKMRSRRSWLRGSTRVPEGRQGCDRGGEAGLEGIPRREVELADDGPRAMEMPEEERRALILALKKKWDNRNAQYQLISHQTVLDTINKLRKKEALRRSWRTWSVRLRSSRAIKKCTYKCKCRLANNYESRISFPFCFFFCIYLYFSASFVAPQEWGEQWFDKVPRLSLKAAVVLHNFVHFFNARKRRAAQCWLLLCSHLLDALGPSLLGLFVAARAGDESAAPPMPSIIAVKDPPRE